MAQNDISDLNVEGTDLIDFEVGSPELLPGILSAASSQDALQTLLDSEPLHLEETLQTCSPTQRSRSNSKDSIELDQVLITIEDDALYNSKDEIIIKENEATDNNCHCSVETNKEIFLSDDNQKTYDETLTVLNELDRILNIHDDITGSEEQINSNEEEHISVEDCLRELDDYLQSFDVSSEDDCLCPTELVAEQRSILKDSEIKQKLSNLVARSASLGRCAKFGRNESRKISEWGTLARNHRFRATISALRKELKPAATKEKYDILQTSESDNETVEDSNDTNLIQESSNSLIKNKPLSSSTKDLRQAGNLIRNGPSRATICGLHNAKSLLENNGIHHLHLKSDKAVFSEPVVRDQCLSTAVGSVGRDRTSGEGAHVVFVSDEELDWGWMQELNACALHATGNDPEVDATKHTAADGYAMDDVTDLETTLKSSEEDCNVLPDLIPIEEVKNMEPSSREVMHNPEEVSKEVDAPVSITRNEEIMSEIQPRLTKAEPQQSTSWIRSSLRRINSENDFDRSPKPSDLQRPSSSSWLRSSMRRIQHFRLPSDPSPSESIVTTTIPQDVEIATVISQPRPFSAPVRINSEVSVSTVQTDVRVNGVSDESVVRVHARSSSESSRSRRARSLSSSESSLASSVDSTQSCAEGTSANTTAGADVPPATGRR